jgi:hypothetical protein
MEQPWCDRHYTDTHARKFARRRQCHADHAGFRRRVSRLSDLALIGGDRCGVDDDATLAVFQRIELHHSRRGQPQQVEAANQIDADHPLECGQRHRPFASDDPTRGADAGTVHQDPRRPVRVACLCHRCLCGCRIADITRNADAADALRTCCRR